MHVFLFQVSLLSSALTQTIVCPSARHKSIHLRFEKAIKLTFVNQSLVCIPVWIEQIKLLILGFGIFGIVHSRPKIWPFEN